MSRLNRYTTPHEESGTCNRGHCWIHKVDEINQGALGRCRVCGHVWQNCAELETEYALTLEAWNEAWRTGEHRREHLTPRRAEEIDTCPFCVAPWRATDFTLYSDT